MKLYTAAIYSNSLELEGRLYAKMTEAERGHLKAIRYILESYHYVNNQTKVDAMRRDGIKIFLDSGAFSAFTQGVTINLDQYCAYIKRNTDIIDIASVLDAVGDPQKTADNQAAIESNGIQVLPCYHYGEDESYLCRYLEVYPYITIGGMVPIGKPQLRTWLDRIWSRYLCRPDGTPRVKVHAFGMTSLSLMVRYPWYSVDSSSWVQGGSMGNVLIPGVGMFAISSQSASRKHAQRHMATINPPQQAELLARISRFGFTWERLAEEYLARWMFNIASFTEMNRELETKQLIFKLEQQTLF